MLGLHKHVKVLSVLLYFCCINVSVRCQVQTTNALQPSQTVSTGTALSKALTGSALFTPTPVGNQSSPSVFVALSTSVTPYPVPTVVHPTSGQTSIYQTGQRSSSLASSSISPLSSFSYSSSSSSSASSSTSSASSSSPSSTSSTSSSSSSTSSTSSPSSSSSTSTTTSSISQTTTTTTTSTPPLASTMLTPPLLPKSCGNGQDCCFKALEQIPARIRFTESLPKGSVLADIKHVENVTFDVTVVRPSYVRDVIKDYFIIKQSGSSGYVLSLDHALDLEEVSVQSGQIGDVHQFQLSVTCIPGGSSIPFVPSSIVNVTVEDEDDAMPVFLYNYGNSDCVVPIYTADTTEDYMGMMAIAPGQIQAVDGDVTIQNNITYRVMHSEPDDYHVYFTVDADDGSVNKTKVMNSSVSKKYVLFVEAVEDSVQQRSRVAVLAIAVYPPPVRRTDAVVVNPFVRLTLEIISVLLLFAFLSGMAVICNHRYRLKQARVAAALTSVDVIRDVTIPKSTINTSVTSLDYKPAVDSLQVASPSQVLVNPARSDLFSEKPRKIVIKRPLDTKNRPQWNAPSQQKKRFVYDPYIRT